MNLGAVVALVGAAPEHADLLEETREALAGQTVPPIAVVVQAPNAAPARSALAERPEWLWLLDGVTVPQIDALEAFGAALKTLEGLPEPLLLAGKVVDATGAMHPDALPRHEIFEKQYTVDAIERGLVQLRAAPSGSLLVRREAFDRFGQLRADLPPSWAVFEFTARALQSWGDTGYLVPSSVAVRGLLPRPPGRRGGGLRTRARLLAGPAWTPTERLWEGFLVAEAAVRAVRGPVRRG